MAASDDSCMLCVHWAGVIRRAWPTHCGLHHHCAASVCVCVCVCVLVSLMKTFSKYNSSSVFFCFFSLPLVCVCVWVPGVMSGLCSCERKRPSVSTRRQTGGHYQAQGQTPHSILSHNITAPLHYHSRGAAAAHERTGALFALVIRLIRLIKHRCGGFIAVCHPPRPRPNVSSFIRDNSTTWTTWKQ